MLKDLLVYLDGESQDDVRLAYGEQIAESFEAHLTGLYCNYIPEVILAGDPGMTAAQVSADMQTAAIEAGGSVADKLKKRMDKLSVNSELRRMDVHGSQAGASIAAEARSADLFVATRPYSKEVGHAEVMETVLFNAGRGCLFVPPNGQPKKIETVLIAWRNTREAALALSHAIPFLRQAKKVIVAIVAEEDKADGPGEMPGADISRHLDRHGINVELKQLTGENDAASALLKEVESSKADLIVMGGYGHSRFREWVLGGVTRTILSKAEVPVLTAH